MTARYKSIALWPKGTFDSLNNLTSDEHDTREQAKAVCQLLHENGAGGDKQSFPLKAWVEVI